MDIRVKVKIITLAAFIAFLPSFDKWSRNYADKIQRKSALLDLRIDCWKTGRDSQNSYSKFLEFYDENHKLYRMTKTCNMFWAYIREKGWRFGHSS